MRNFVLVTATETLPMQVTRTCSGIRKLKRGVPMEQFIVDYLSAVNVNSEDTETFCRDNTWTVLLRSQSSVLSWNFTEYPEDELLAAVSHLTRDELLRDLKELLPLKELQ